MREMEFSPAQTRRAAEDRDPALVEVRDGGRGLAPSQTLCLCGPEELNRYWRRFGSALLDRIELRVPVVPPRLGELTGSPGESSAVIARRVARAVELQRERLGKLPERPRRNARLPVGVVARYCPLSVRGEQTLKTAVSKLALSGRAYHGILRLARTIADLEGRDTIDAVHVLEAVEHRRQGDDPYDILAAHEY
jgi:magnesium chelatase family protein